jgi:hypothetical protein
MIKLRKDSFIRQVWDRIKELILECISYNFLILWIVIKVGHTHSDTIPYLAEIITTMGGGISLGYKGYKDRRAQKAQSKQEEVTE